MPLQACLSNLQFGQHAVQAIAYIAELCFLCVMLTHHGHQLGTSIGQVAQARLPYAWLVQLA